MTWRILIVGGIALAAATGAVLFGRWCYRRLASTSTGGRFRVHYGPEGAPRSTYTFTAHSLEEAVTRSALTLAASDRCVTIEALDSLEAPTIE